jgi:hypothetical protein
MSAERRAARLLRWYPREWRRRYGDEFAALLVDEFSERPRSARRAIDVGFSGLLARVRETGLAGPGREAERQLRAGLAALSCALAVFVVAGVALWSQLTIGWQWSAPSSGATRTGMLLMSAAMAAIVTLLMLAAMPIAWTVVRVVLAGRARPLAGGLALAVAGFAVLVIGSTHFGQGWPGTGGHPWGGRGLVPGPAARVAWAATLWISAYWAHPGALSAFPSSEVTWMVLAPTALALALCGVAQVVRRLPLSVRLLRYEAWLGCACSLAMAAFLAGACSWVLMGGSSPKGLFAVGVIDVAGVALMVVALLVAFRAVQRARFARV